jgi:predicted CoA-binding protein
MNKDIKNYVEQKVWAVVGATDNTKKFGWKIYKKLKNQGFIVYPVNPKLKELDGEKAYSRLSELPEKPGAVDIVVPPQVTEEVVKECKELGIERVWMQPGAESMAAIKYCQDNSIEVIYNACVLVDF